MNRNNTLKIIYSALCLCLALVLPLFTGQIRILGKMLNLMHIPIFLCGMLCGWKYGGLIGFITPLLRSVIFGMPNLYPNAVGMAFELGVYGLVSGILYKILYDKKGGIFIALIVAMLVGRIVWGLVTLLLWSFMGDIFTFALFIKGAFIDSVIGIVIQFVLVPIIISILQKNGLAPLTKKDL